MGEGEYENYSKELEAEKKDDEKIEAKIRQLRKEKNKARLHPDRDNGPRKIDENNYVDIQEVWKKTEITKQQKNKIQEDEQNNAKRAKKNEKVPTQLAGNLTNLRTIEKVITVL